MTLVGIEAIKVAQRKSSLPAPGTIGSAVGISSPAGGYPARRSKRFVSGGGASSPVRSVGRSVGRHLSLVTPASMSMLSDNERQAAAGSYDLRVL